MATTKRKRPTAAQLANPGERAKIATSQLPAKYQRLRRQNDRAAAVDRNPLYDPSQILTGRPLATAVHDIADLQVRPQVDAINRSITDTKTQGSALAQRVAGYYGGLAAQEQTGVDAQHGIRESLNQDLAGIASTAKGQIDQANQTERSRAQADAAQRGQGNDGGVQQRLAEEMAARQSGAAQSAQAFESAGAQQGAGAETLANAMRSSGILQGGELQGQLANRTAGQVNDLTGKRADAEASRGPLEAKTLQDLRQQGYENIVTARGLGIKQEQIAADAAKATAQVKLAQDRLSETKRSNRAGESTAAQRAGETARHNTVSENQRGQELDISRARVDVARRRLEKDLRTGPKEPAASRAIKRQIGNALQSYQRYLKPGAHKKNGQSYSIGEIDKLGRDAKIPNDVLSAARDIAQFGYLTPESEQRLKLAGVRVPAGWHRSGAQSYGGRT